MITFKQIQMQKNIQALKWIGSEVFLKYTAVSLDYLKIITWLMKANISSRWN